MSTTAAPKPKRRTRERVLALSLKLFNDFGEPNVTTTTISAAMEISPGNLYYHFRNKDEIVNDIFAVFEREMDELLVAGARRSVTIEDMWLFLHVLFETIWKYRFLYRDLSDLLSRNRLLEVEFKRILDQKVKTTEAMFRSLASTGALAPGDHNLEALATNMMVVATYWLSFAYVRNPRNFVESEVSAEGAYQVMSLLAPYLRGESRALFVKLADAYKAVPLPQNTGKIASTPISRGGRDGKNKVDPVSAPG